MAGDELDLCACLWSQDLSMLRLLSFLRQSQSYCTDTECLTDTRLPDPSGASVENSFMMMVLLVVFGILLYAFRPSSLRRSLETKERDNNFGSDNNPPMPPPAIN